MKTWKMKQVCTSFYADDAALFLNPAKEEVKIVFELLEFFGKTSGLRINLNKCTIFPIGCENLYPGFLEHLDCSIGSLPCTYLGLPLSFRKPRRVDCQLFLDKVASKLKPWKGKLMSRTGRLALINSVLTATMTYFLTVFDPPKWLIKKTDKIRQNFLGAERKQAQEQNISSIGNRFVSPKIYDGLGVKDLHIFSKALRLRWPWLNWQDAERPWHDLPLPVKTIILFSRLAPRFR
jgi:hypothetical protein